MDTTILVSVISAATALAVESGACPKPCPGTTSAGSAVQKFDQMVFPQLRGTRSPVSSCLGACGDENIAAVLQTMDLALHDAELWGISLVVGGVNGQHRCGYRFQTRRRVVIA